MPTLEQEMARYAGAKVGGTMQGDRAQPRERPARKPGNAKSRFRLIARFWQHPETGELPHAAKAVWCYLWMVADGKGVCFPSLTRIGGRMGCSRVYVQKLIRKLKQTGFVAVLAPGTSRNKRSNLYQIRVPGPQANG
jgi:hypothetical protein